MKASIIYERSVHFALAIVQLVQNLNDNHHFILGRQILKSGTSIGANIAEALEGQSRNDFISKMSIALKEASETKYWLFILDQSGFLEPDHQILIEEAEAIYSILNRIVKTTKHSAA